MTQMKRTAQNAHIKNDSVGNLLLRKKVAIKSIFYIPLYISMACFPRLEYK